MAVWMVRAGQHGEREDFALNNGVAIVGWYQMPDMASFTSREALQEVYAKVYPDAKPKKMTIHVSQLWFFRDRIQEGDIVVLPLKSRSSIAFGRIVGPYRYRGDFPTYAQHTRAVEWVRIDVPRGDIGRDLLFSFGAALTVCRISRANAEQRVTAIIKGSRDPSLSSPPSPLGGGDGEDDPQINVETYAKDQIRERLSAQYSGHGFGSLMAAILKAQGYKVRESTPGADGGVDIVAGSGFMGFDPPRLCVQVKSQASPIDVGVLRELQGVMKNYGAEHGLLFSWGGFKESVYREARTLFFEIRLWDSNQFIDALFEAYDRLAEDIQADIPLKKIWALVDDEAN